MVAKQDSPASEEMVASLGDIHVYQTLTFTPGGSHATQGLHFELYDHSRTTRGIPPWAILCVVLFFWTIFALPLLFVRSERTKGVVQVRVWSENDGFEYTHVMRAQSLEHVTDLRRVCAYAENYASLRHTASIGDAVRIDAAIRSAEKRAAARASNRKAPNSPWKLPPIGGKNIEDRDRPPSDSVAAYVAIDADNAAMTVVPPSDHGPGWEYVYFSSEIARGLSEHRAEFEEYSIGFVRPTQESITDPAGHVSELANSIGLTVENVTRILSPPTLERTFGPSRAPADDESIRHLAADLVEVYATMIAWGQQVRGAPVPAAWRKVYWALSNYVGLPLRQIQEVSAALSANVGNVVQDLRAGRDPKDKVTVVLNVLIDPEAVKEFEAALQTLQVTRSPLAKNLPTHRRPEP
jgi:hypothetical protein